MLIKFNNPNDVIDYPHRIDDEIASKTNYSHIIYGFDYENAIFNFVKGLALYSNDIQIRAKEFPFNRKHWLLGHRAENLFPGYCYVRISGSGKYSFFVAAPKARLYIINTLLKDLVGYIEYYNFYLMSLNDNEKDIGTWTVKNYILKLHNQIAKLAED